MFQPLLNVQGGMNVWQVEAQFDEGHCHARAQANHYGTRTHEAGDRS
jgi:hypothetical protein